MNFLKGNKVFPNLKIKGGEKNGTFPNCGVVSPRGAGPAPPVILEVPVLEIESPAKEVGGSSPLRRIASLVSGAGAQGFRCPGTRSSVFTNGTKLNHGKISLILPFY